MSATAWLRARRVELLWVAFAAANLVAMLLTPDWETIPFHFIWVSLTILYGFRVWGRRGHVARARRRCTRPRASCC